MEEDTLSNPTRDVTGWRETIWGMNEFEILARFEDEITKLPERLPRSDNQYVDFRILGYEIDGYKYDVDFYMDSETEGLVKVNIGAYYMLTLDEDDDSSDEDEYLSEEEEEEEEEEDDDDDEDDDPSEEEPFDVTIEDVAAGSELRIRFDSLKRLLTDKYGKPFEDHDHSTYRRGPFESHNIRWLFPTTTIDLSIVITNEFKSTNLEYYPSLRREHSKI